MPNDTTQVLLATSYKEFLVKEYKSLKEEIAGLVKHSRELELYALAGFAAFYPWYLEYSADKRTLWIPIFLAVLGAARSWAVAVRIAKIASYLRMVETEFGLYARRLGWEHFLLPRPKEEDAAARPGKPPWYGPFVTTAAIFWIALLLVAIAATRVFS
jgi:hypothetical protein